MRLPILLTSVSIILAGCTTVSIDPSDHQKFNARTQTRISHVRKYVPVDSKEFKFEDKNIVVTYLPNTIDAGTSFHFQNKTDSPVKIIWDETTYIEPNGQSSKVFYSGVKIDDRNSSLPASLIPPKASLADDILPTAAVFWGSYGWSYIPLCGSVDNVPKMNGLIMKVPSYEISDDECLGKVFGYFITYEVDGKKHNFTIKFKFISKEPQKIESLALKPSH